MSSAGPGSSNRGSNRGSPPSGGLPPRGPPPDRQLSSSGDGRHGDSSSSRTLGSPTNPFGPGIGFDPARSQVGGLDARREELFQLSKHFDLPAEAYLNDPSMHRFTLRPGFNQTGKPIQVEVNQFRMSSLDTGKKIYQYDVTVTPPSEKRPGALFKKIWNHENVQSVLKRTRTKWLYDGRKLAWSSALLERGEARITVDLDANKPPEKRKPPYYIIIKQTTTIKMPALQAYLEGRMAWDNAVLECMNFLDHVVRQFPSEELIAIKRTFFHAGMKRHKLDGIIEIVKGVYSSIRMNSTARNGGMGLGMNVDVCNTAFWTGNLDLVTIMCRLLPPLLGKDARFQTLPDGSVNPKSLVPHLMPLSKVDEKGALHYQISDAFKFLRRLHKLRFTLIGPLQSKNNREYVIFKIAYGDEYGAEGAHALNFTFDMNGRKMTIAQYWKEKYKYELRHPRFPIILTAKNEAFPAEVVLIKDWQRYPFKLDPNQTASMIKFAVTRPPARRADIMASRNVLNWPADPYMKEFGIRFDPQFATTNACLIPNPEIEFQGSKLDPKMGGRWDLRGRKFWRSNPRPLKSWACIILERSVQESDAKAFAKTFKTVYQGHGGKVEADAIVETMPDGKIPEVVKSVYEQLVKRHGRADMVFWILRFRNSGVYERIKKNCDCRFGLLSQVVLATHVQKNAAQYHSNVSMKVNSKLGGATCRVAAPKGQKISGLFKIPNTIQIGVDVSHASPGSPAASMAAMTASVDIDATRFAACVETNGQRVEVLTPDNINNFLHNLIPIFCREVGAIPKHVFYFRDGVSEGQFAHIIMREVAEMKAYFNRTYKEVPKFTVIVATKRHHIRFFPKDGDRNGNPLPGTLVEQEVTHPFQWDFYLCSHVAIQGTARPVHYHVIMDEAKCTPPDLQKMIYHQCYQYARSTTPVSLHPAIYYAHLASSRARAHENVSAAEGPRSGPKAVEIIQDRLSKGLPAPGVTDTPDFMVAPLIPIGGKVGPNVTEQQQQFFKGTMWYI